MGVNPFYHKNQQGIAIVKKDDGKLEKVIMRVGRASDFKVGKCFFVMTGVWENRLESAKSYDGQIGKKYDGKVTRYNMRIGQRSIILISLEFQTLKYVLAKLQNHD